MLVLFFFLIILTSYTGAGVMTARSVYGRAMADWRVQSAGSPRPEEIAAARVEFESIGHESYCYLSYRALRRQGCNCVSKRKWWTAKRRYEGLCSNAPIKPTASLKPVLSWPAHVVKGIVVSGDAGRKLEAEQQRLESLQAESDRLDAMLASQRKELK